MDNSTLKTCLELEQWLKANCYHFNSYSINGNTIYEGFVLDKFEGTYLWYYTERGQKRNIQYFEAEQEAVKVAFQHIVMDKWARTHCIGFTRSQAKANQLTTILKGLNIEYTEDKIPYDGIQKPVYRIFVFGSAILKVKHLKATYFEL